MERRRSRRKTFHLNAESISGDTHFAVFIENLSEEGINIITAPSHAEINFIPQKTINLKLKLSTGQILDLTCRVMWSHIIPPGDTTCSVGMEVIEPPEQYREFVKTLQ
jgi:hypothetical protein